MKLIDKIVNLYNIFEMKLRHRLSHWPILYAFIGSIGVVLIWRGVWMIADDLNMSGGASLIYGVLISIITGLFVSFFVGDKIIITGIKKEKRIDEKTESEIKKEEVTLVEIKKQLKGIKKDIEEI
jgi:H+/gluconate symporter-like permease